jgi:hypothetical protein
MLILDEEVVLFGASEGGASERVKSNYGIAPSASEIIINQPY